MEDYVEDIPTLLALILAYRLLLHHAQHPTKSTTHVQYGPS